MSEEFKSKMQRWGAVVLDAYLGPLFVYSVRWRSVTSPTTRGDLGFLEYTTHIFGYGGKVIVPLIILGLLAGKFARSPIYGFALAHLISGVGALATAFIALRALVGYHCALTGC